MLIQGHHSAPVTPKQLGYYFPAEWAKHIATWLSWPHRAASWPGKIHKIYGSYSKFVQALATGELIRINVLDDQMEVFARKHLLAAGADMSRVTFFHFETNDAWCRDYGPAFLVRASAQERKAIVAWSYNAWGAKYPPFDKDAVIARKIAAHFHWPVFYPNVVMEGGSVELNGRGSLITTTSCLLHPNRNPHLTQQEIEWYLQNYYGVDQVLWLGSGSIAGDDTDGHIDNIVRFVDEDTIIVVVAEDKNDTNYPYLQRNLQVLKKMRLLNGKQLNIVELPLPAMPITWNDTRLPASYANFYIGNGVVVVPVYLDANDDRALTIVQKCFPNRVVTGIDARDIILGLGGFHCLSQQEPA